MNSKLVFITGKDFTVQGKILVLSSVARLLKARGFRVTMLKLASCLNIDFQPEQECHVTGDGQEVDSELGTFERFAEEPVTQANYVTLGNIIQSVINHERRGEFGNAEVTVSDHIVNEIKQRIYRLAKSDKYDFVLVDINGIPNDMDAAPAIEAARQIRYENPSACYFIHYGHEWHDAAIINAVKTIQGKGIQPDALLTAANMEREQRELLAKSCNIAAERVAKLSADCNIFTMPAKLHKRGVDTQLLRFFDIESSQLDMREWELILDKHIAANENDSLEIAVIGNFNAVLDSLRIAALHQEVNVEASTDLSEVDGAVISKYDYATIEWCMEHDIPTLCIADGMKSMVNEFALSVMKLKDEVIESTPLRLGADSCTIRPNTEASKAYGDTKTTAERYRSNFQIKSEYRQRIEQAGMMCSGEHPQTHSMEILEIPHMRWFIGTQFNPEYSSTIMAPNPLFTDFLHHAINYHNVKNQNG